jgi:sugar phosphate permease
MAQTDLPAERFEPSPAQPGESRPTHVRYQVLLFACLLALVAYIHRNGFAAAGPSFNRDLRLNHAQMGYLMAAFTLAYALFEVPWGLIGDRLGVGRLLVVMTLGWSVLTAAVALALFLPRGTAWPFVFLLVIRFLFGACQAGAFPALSRMMADWMPITERGTAQGLIWTFSRAGGALAPLLIVGLIAHERTWTTPLVLVSFLGLLWCLFFLPFFHNRPEDMPEVNTLESALIAAGRPASPANHGAVPWAQLLGSRNVWALCLMYGCGGFSATFFITLLPTYLTDQRHFNENQTKWLSALPLAGGALACSCGGIVSDWIIRRTRSRKWGRRLPGMIGHAGAGLAILATTWTHDLNALAVLLSATFCMNDLAMGPAWASCADVGERYAGTLGGAMNMIGNLGATLGALMAGTLLQAGQDAMVFVIFACSFWLASLCWLGVDVTQPIITAGPSAEAEAPPAG